MAGISRHWHHMLEEARAIIALLPMEHAGKCVLQKDGGLCGASQAQLAGCLATNQILFHSGCIRGAFPQIRG
jgi:hypothetical protein